MRYILGLGSNMGERGRFLRKGRAFLKTLGKIIVESSTYETTPVGMADGTENFFNSVLVLDAEIPADKMLKEIKKFEKEAGRSLKNSHMRPREIDIDILLAEDIVLHTPNLVIPHPRLADRKFVLVPLAEILPEMIHPVFGRTIKELLEELDSEEEIRIVKPGFKNRN